MKAAAILAALALPAALYGVDVGPVEVKGYGFAEFRSAYYSRGKIVNKEPILPLLGRAAVTLGKFGYIGGSVWTVNAVSSGGQSADRRNAFHEVDLKPYYGYDWDFGSGWVLGSAVARQWVLYPGFRNDPPTINEWQVSQSLHNPYATPYYQLRHAFRNVSWNYWRVGLVRAFPLGCGLVLKPNFWCDFGDENHFEKQYGRACSDGLMALNGELRLEWWFVDNFGMHVAVQQYGVVSRSGRDALQKNPSPQSVTDLTIFTVGLAAKF